jgi:GNAT superfamily N-acetyltransferase
MITKTFEQTIYHKWTNSFGCPAETAYQSGTTIIPESKYEDKKIIILQEIGPHVFAQIDPFYYQDLHSLLKDLPYGTSISGVHIQAVWGKDSIKTQSLGKTYYLQSTDLPAYTLHESFSLRKLIPEDAEAMSILHAANTPEEVQEGYVEVTHQIAFGCFHNGLLVAASSGYERTGFLDIGVLTHPDYRRKGLGKAVVGELCKWANEKHIIPQYRHDVTNINSQHVAESLNFKPYFKTEAITFR